MTHHTPPLDFNATAHGEVTVIEMAGSIDSLSSEDLTEALQRQIREGRIRLVGDMSAVSYISSAGLRALLSATKEARNQGGDLRLAGVTDHVHKVLDLSGFTSILHVYPDAQAALESFSR